jgi:glycosyltransferase involved in cell wall biosynthesis
VVLEAFACGRRVVATNLDGVPEAFEVGGEGRLVPAEDVSALANAMIETAELPPLDRFMRERLHARVKATFSLETAARRLLELYEELGVSRIETGLKRV